MPQLTVVVPLMDQVDAFENTLASILRYQDPRLELVVTHDGRYDDPHGILGEIENVVVATHRETSVLGRVAAAAHACHSPWIHWISPGIEVTDGWCDELLNDLARCPELGLVSPRIVAADRSEDGRCLASALLALPSGHAQYLEDVVGEEWSADQVMDQPNLAGPTGWGGFCRRHLLEQWQAQWGRIRLPQGYAELSLGLMVRHDGWSHQFTDSCLVASQEIAERIEQGIARDGRAAATLIGRTQAGSAGTKLVRSLTYALQEAVSGIIYPGNLSVAIARLSHLSQATRQTSFEMGDDPILTLPSATHDRSVSGRPSRAA